jgi:YD repeat-containing protein
LSSRIVCGACHAARNRTSADGSWTYSYDFWGNRIEKKVDANGDNTFEMIERYAYNGPVACFRGV